MVGAKGTFDTFVRLVWLAWLASLALSAPMGPVARPGQLALSRKRYGKKPFVLRKD